MTSHLMIGAILGRESHWLHVIRVRDRLSLNEEKRQYVVNERPRFTGRKRQPEWGCRTRNLESRSDTSRLLCVLPSDTRSTRRTSLR